MDNAKILIVEDEAIIAMQIERRLKNLGYQVTSIVDTGEKAIEKAESDKPDIILMDIRIKGEMDGIDAADTIRSRFDIPVIFSTAYLDEERIERAKLTMPFGYILKPIQERDLKVTIEMALYVANVDIKRKQSEQVLKHSRDLYQSLFTNMLGGFAVHEVVRNEDGVVIDYIFLEVNEKFEEFTGLGKDMIGKRVTEVLPGIENDPLDWIGTYGRVVDTGQSIKFEQYSSVLDRHYDCSAYKTNERCFAVIFNDISQRVKAENTLKDSEEQYRIVVENTKDLIVLQDDKGKILMMNRSSNEPFKGKITGLKDKTLWDLFPKEFANKRYKQNKEVIASGKQKSLELEIPFESGSRWYRSTITPVKLGNTNAVYSIHADITEPRKIRERLKESEHRLAAHIELTPMGVIEFDNEFIILSWNPGAERIFGYTKEEAMGRSTFDILVPDYEHEGVKKIHLWENPKVMENINDNKTKSGRIITCHWFNTPMYNIHGKVVGLTCVCQDITNQLKAEKALKESEEKYRDLVQSSNSIIMKFDSNYNIVFINKFGQDFFGFSEDEIIGRNTIGTILPSLESTGRNLEEMVENLFRNPEAFIDNENENMRKNRERVWVAWRNQGIYDDSGKLSGLLCTGYDITKRKQAEEALQKAHDELENKVKERTFELKRTKEEAENANSAKSDFLANMSHELRTPMNAILGFAQIMARDPDVTENQRENLKVINESGAHLLELINDVLELSKIEVGRIQLNKQPFDFYQTLESIKEMISVRAENKSLQFTIDYDLDLPRYLNGDEHRIRQILLNLLGNAVKFTDKGLVSLSITGTEKRLFFEVEDTGRGIEPEEFETLFDPFTQSLNSQTNQEGTGLGLSISRKFIQLMNGDITVESKIGEGSAFKFDLEIEPVAALDTENKQPYRNVIGLEPHQPDYRILIVEDNYENRLYLGNLLRQIGFNVREATNGFDGIDKFETWQPDLIFMDMRMPGLDGYEATRRIKASGGEKVPKIIAVTASAFEEDRKKTLSAGCDDFIRKPILESYVFEVLAKYLSVRFTFADEEESLVQTAVKLKSTKKLTKKDLSILSEGLLKDLKKAVIELDTKTVRLLVEKIRLQGHDKIAEQLENLVKDYSFNIIDNLIDS